MANLLNIDIGFPKIASKKSMKLLSDRFVQPDLVKKVNPQKIEILTEEEVTMELVDGLTVTCHALGCFHITCEDFDEQKIRRIGKALPNLMEIYDIGKESENVEIALFAGEGKIPRRKIARIVNKGVKPDLRAQVKDLYQGDVKVGGIRFICPPDLSCILDVSGISTRIGPRKMALDKLKDGKVVIGLIEESISRIARAKNFRSLDYGSNL